MKPRPQPDHPVSDIITKRWSPRSFAPRHVTKEEILSVIEAARWAASAFNAQPWRFIYGIKGDADIHQRLTQCLTETNRSWAADAPVLILTMVKKYFDHNGKENRWAFHDLGLAIGNLTAEATSREIYAHSMAGFSVSVARELFALPDELEPVTIIALGYPGDPETLADDLKTKERAQQERLPIVDLILKR